MCMPNVIFIARRHEMNYVCVMFQMREGARRKMKTFRIIEAQTYFCEMLDTHNDIVRDLFLLMLSAIGLRNQHGSFIMAILLFILKCYLFNFVYTC